MVILGIRFYGTIITYLYCTAHPIHTIYHSSLSMYVLQFIYFFLGLQKGLCYTTVGFTFARGITIVGGNVVMAGRRLAAVLREF